MKVVDTFEFNLEIIDEAYRDDLIVALVRQGYTIWNNERSISVIIQDYEVEVYSEKDVDADNCSDMDEPNCDDCEYADDCDAFDEDEDDKNKPTN